MSEETKHPAYTIGILIQGKGNDYYKLPCGNHLGQLQDVPCPCGDPNHFLLKVQVQKS